MLCVTQNFLFILGMESHHRFVSVNIFIYMLYFKRSFAHNVVLKKQCYIIFETLHHLLYEYWDLLSI